MTQKQNKKEWDYFTHIWKTESQYLSWVRGQIRNIWKTSPQRSEFIKSKVLSTPKYDKAGNPVCFKNGKIKNYKSFKCEACGVICYDVDKAPGTANRKTYAVDHIRGNHSLISFSQAPVFFEAMLRVELKDLQILCHNCHDVKSYAEKYGIKEDEARITKEAIRLEKIKATKEFFILRNLPIPSNAIKRRESIITILKKEKFK